MCLPKNPETSVESSLVDSMSNFAFIHLKLSSTRPLFGSLMSHFPGHQLPCVLISYLA